MLRKWTVVPVFAALLLGAASGVAARSLSCPELQGAKPQAQLEYLQRDRAALKPACIAYAS